ncbi:MAG: transposase [Myxococcota bacterium]
MDAEVLRRDPACVTEEHKRGVLALKRMLADGVLDGIESWFPVTRSRGHGVVSLFAAATMFLSAGPLGGIRPFFERMSRVTRRRLGSLAGVRSLPTAGSISRALSGFEVGQVRPFIAALLAASVPRELLNHPAVLHHDAVGDGWAVMDLDPTVHAYRRRDLPEGDDLPEGKRRAQGEAGYVGRKRGESRMRVFPVLHDGAGLWLAMVLLPEEGSIVPHCGELMRAAMGVLAEHGDASRVIARGDGELGSAGTIRAIIDSGAHPLVRLSRYQLLDREQVVAHLREAHWYPVRRGESGLDREAAELGTFTLRGSTDAEEEAVVTVRVVVTRFPRTSEPDHGVLRAGHQLEIFATTLDPLRWPPADVIELYRGRSSIENRFAQEDREFDLGRNFSFHPPGQEWMCGVGMFLWNEQVAAGWASDPPPADRPLQTARPALKELRRPPLPLEPQPMEHAGVAGDRGVLPPSEAQAILDRQETTESGSPPDLPDVRGTLGELVARAFQDVTAWPGWQVDPTSAQLRCPEGRRLFPYSVAGKSGASGARLAVRTEPWACNGCPIRASCYSGRGPYKEISRVIGEPDVAVVAASISALHAVRDKPGPRLWRKRTPTPAHTKSEAPSTGSSPVFTPPKSDVAGPFYFEAPRFLPAAARGLVREYAASHDIILRVSSPRTRRPPRPHRLLTKDAAGRAHRRKTIQQTRARDRVQRETRVRTVAHTRSAENLNASSG